jgi:PAS domain S-box-containing protein
MAIGFALAGASLLLRSRGELLIARALALIVALLGLVALSKRILGIGALPPGGMDLPPALKFLLFGSALLIWRTRLSQPLILAVILISLAILTGHLYGIPQLFDSAPHILTAVAFISLCVGALLLEPRRGVMSVLTSDSLGGAVARRLLPAAIALPIILGWLGIRGHYVRLYSLEVGSAIFVISNAVTFTILIWWAGWSLSDLEARRHRQERQYRLLFESNPHPMWVYDVETLKFLAVNDRAVECYGYSRDEFLQMTIKDIGQPEEVSRLLEQLKSERETGGAELLRAGEWKHRKKDGSVILVDIISNDIVWAGRPARLVLANDITERKRAELYQLNQELEQRVRERTAQLEAINAAVAALKEGAADYLLKDRLARLGKAVESALQKKRLRDEKRRAELELRESEEKFRQLAENIREVFWITSPDLNQMIYASPAYEEIWGMPLESLYRNPRQWLEAICEQDRRRTIDALAKVASEETTASVEYRIIRPDGSMDTGSPIPYTQSRRASLQGNWARG